MPEISAGGAGLAGLATYVLAGAGLLVLLGIVLWLARRSNGREVARKTTPARRLAVIDQIDLDDKRRLVLIQRDGVQHLVILGGANELLVESGIGEARAVRHQEPFREPRELRTPEPVRETPELPAFPVVPTRDVPSRDLPTRDVPSRDLPSRDLPSRDVPPLAARQAALPEPVAPSFVEPTPRRAPAAEAAVAPRPAPARSEPPHPQPAPLPPAAQRPEPAAAAIPSAPPTKPAPATPPAPALPPVPAPTLRAEPKVPPAAEPVPQPVPLAPDVAPAAAEPAKMGGLLARLRRSRQNEAGPAPVEAANDRLEDTEPAVEPRLSGLDQADTLPEMPAHSVPEVVLDPPPAPEPETRSPATASGRVEPDMSKLFDMIVPAQESAPAAPVQPAPTQSASAQEVAVQPLPAAPTAQPSTPAAASTPSAPSPTKEQPAEPSRVAVKIDPFFANMAQRLEETLRRPIPPGSPTAPPAPPPQAKPAMNAAEIERVIDLALGTPSEPAKGAPSAAANPPAAQASPRAPEVMPPTRDELEEEMANLLGRGHR